MASPRTYVYGERTHPLVHYKCRRLIYKVAGRDRVQRAGLDRSRRFAKTRWS